MKLIGVEGYNQLKCEWYCLKYTMIFMIVSTKKWMILVEIYYTQMLMTFF